jgi:histidyl-tRNA synthetase
MKKNRIKSVKGTRDFYPNNMAIRNFLYETAKNVASSFGYQEWDGPFLEPIDLYASKSGEELVKEQSFVFPDRSGDLIALRPELTPTLARMIAQKQNELVFPLRWWSWGPFWRYERPQKGRSREFFQWNIDLIGVNSPEADAEIVSIAASFLREAGLSSKQVKILINNRQLMDQELSQLNIAKNKRSSVFKLIDRLDKMSESEWGHYANQLQLTGQQITGIKALLGDSSLWEKSEDLSRFFELAKVLEFDDYIQFSPKIIRGLDYYTGIVFEVWDTTKEFRAILGGGRYDNLVEAVGGSPLPGVGFAMGDVVISLVLDKYNCLPERIYNHPAQILVTTFNENYITHSLEIATTLRNSGISVITYPKVAKLGKQFKFCDRVGVKLAAVLGPDEVEKQTITIKNLHTSEQIIINQENLVETVRNLLEQVNS